MKTVLCAVVLVLVTTAVAVRAASEVADAAMRRDTVAVRALIERRADVRMAQADGTTALHWAARWDDLETARLLLAAGADASVANRAAATPLYLAAVNGSATMIELLLTAGASPNTMLPSGETALMTAVNTGNPAAVRVLLDAGAMANAKEHVNGQTALMWASADNNLAVVRLLLERGADLRACTNIDLVNSARGFIITGKGVPTLPCPRPGRQATAAPAAPAAADSGLNTDPFQTPQPVTPAATGGRRGGRPPGPPLGGSGGGGMTPLLFAVREGATQTVDVLLGAGADINETMADGTSAILLAILNAHYDLALQLLRRGADPNLVDMRNRAPLYAAIDMRNYRWSELPKPPGDAVDPLDVVKALLAAGAQPNVRLTASIAYRGPSNFSNIFETMVGATPFLRAAESGDLTVMRLLLDYGADPRIKTIDNKTALMLASGVGYSDGSTFEWSETVTLDAVRLAYDLDPDVNAASDKGLTALHGAAHRGSNAIIEFLVSKGARLDARDKAGRTPLGWAEGVVVIDQRPARRQPHSVALLRRLMSRATAPAF